MASVRERVLTTLGHTGYRRFIILSRSRTGSYMLMSFLNSHPNVRSDGEILHQLNGRDYRAVIAQAYGREPRSVKAKGFKIFYYHPNGSTGKPIWDYLLAMPGLHVIHLKRRNVLRTLISREIAMQEGVWKTRNPGSKDTFRRKQVSFTVDELAEGFARTRRWEQDGDAMFRDHPLLSIHYEDLVADTPTTFRQVTDFLGVPYVEPRTHLVRQNPETVRELVANVDELEAAFRGTEWQSFFDE
jgi:LPS sulfotransferase NodH